MVLKMKLKELITRMYATSRICVLDAELGYRVVYMGECEYVPDEYLNREVRVIGNLVTHIHIILEYEG